MQKKYYKQKISFHEKYVIFEGYGFLGDDKKIK
jgi:hypothetical protein